MSRADRLAKGIYWDRSWNPFTGCSPVGDACLNCWAKRRAHRLRGRFGYPSDEPFCPTFHPERLSQVNSKQKPQVIALCFMSDPFHERHLVEDIKKMLTIIADCPQHTFIALTKRPDIMQDSLRSPGSYFLDPNDTLPNLVGGVSVWDQPSADRMIPILLQTNLATRIVSLEPCLGAVDFGNWITRPIEGKSAFTGEWVTFRNALHGILLGGESGPGARPMHPDSAKSVRDQCQVAEVSFLFKQHGEWLHESQFQYIESYNWLKDPALLKASNRKSYRWPDGTFSYRIGKKAAGRLLDGVEYNELPEVIP